MSSTGRGKRIDGDRYYTPDRLAEAIVERVGVARDTIALEPSVGGGAFVSALARRGAIVEAIDLDPAAPGLQPGSDTKLGAPFRRTQSFEKPLPFEGVDPSWPRPEIVIGNPPFSCAEAHVRRAIEVVAPGGRVVFLLRLAFLESQERRNLWAEHPPKEVIVLTERPSFTGGGTDSPAYGVFVWVIDSPVRTDPRLSWLSWRGKA